MAEIDRKCLALLTQVAIWTLQVRLVNAPQLDKSLACNRVRRRKTQVAAYYR